MHPLERTWKRCLPGGGTTRSTLIIRRSSAADRKFRRSSVLLAVPGNWREVSRLSHPGTKMLGLERLMAPWGIAWRRCKARWASVCYTDLSLPSIEDAGPPSSKPCFLSLSLFSCNPLADVSLHGTSLIVNPVIRRVDRLRSLTAYGVRSAFAPRVMTRTDNGPVPHISGIETSILAASSLSGTSVVPQRRRG